MIFFERKTHKTKLQIIIHTLCLILPVAAAFAGYFLAPAIWNFFSKEKATELFKFICSIAFFLIPTLIIFILTRKSNPVMNIEIKNN